MELNLDYILEKTLKKTIKSYGPLGKREGGGTQQSAAKPLKVCLNCILGTPESMPELYSRYP